MMSRIGLSLLMLALALSGCWLSAAAARVRLTRDADSVRGCTAVGLARDDEIPDLQRKVAALGGDTGLVVDHYKEYLMVEAYRCRTARSTGP